jgi:hypothetical protein
MNHVAAIGREAVIMEIVWKMEYGGIERVAVPVAWQRRSELAGKPSQTE